MGISEICKFVHLQRPAQSLQHFPTLEIECIKAKN